MFVRKNGYLYFVFENEMRLNIMVKFKIKYIENFSIINNESEKEKVSEF